MRLIGPNCPGIISARDGLFQNWAINARPHIYTAGPRRHRSARSGTLGYEAAKPSSALGIGGHPPSASAATRSTGSSFRDILELFEGTIPDTDAVIMIGEIAARREAEAAAYVRGST